MEDPGTLWLLHWLLLAPKSQLLVWWLAFNEFNAVEFAEAGVNSETPSRQTATSRVADPVVPLRSRTPCRGGVRGVVPLV